MIELEKLQGPWGKSLTAPEAILFAPSRTKKPTAFSMGNPLTLESASSDIGSSEVLLLSIWEMGLTGSKEELGKEWEGNRGLA